MVSNDLKVNAKFARHRPAILVSRAHLRLRRWAESRKHRDWRHRSVPSIKKAMKVYDYKILKAKNPEELSKDVAKALADGWQPLGAPFPFAEGIAQALVKYEE